MSESWDAVVVGAGPNGLVAALTLARAGWRVVLYEANEHPGGGARTEELTLAGFAHDVCSAIHPLGLASPALRNLGLESVGVTWIQPDAPLAHTLRPEQAVMLERSVSATAAGLGVDGKAWTRLFAPGVDAGFSLTDSVLAPLTIPPAHPIALARFARHAVRSAESLSRSQFRGELGPALLAGLSAHSVLPLSAAATAGVGMLLGTLGHSVGWPLAQGGSQTITDALAKLFIQAGGQIRCGERVSSLRQLPPARAVLCDITPMQLVALAGEQMPVRYRRSLQKFRYGPGVFKLDWALDGPVPWKDPQVARAATVHIGGTLDEVRESELAATQGRISERPFLLAAQPSLFDPTRAPKGKHTFWAYCHVPHGSDVDMTHRIEAQIERFAPGFRDLILAKHAMGPAAMQAHNANYIGGDITGGVSDLRQFVARPVASVHPWATPMKGVYLCSSSTPPGGGVHGMCGSAAAELVLRHAASAQLAG
ncbi:phytoene dehydrogenase-like oxidoreductase [Actinobacteria bacterium IMCC26207]|nr:phytoene dehydrogenase-like oxidoreductase [Actinobacteria bacterium IMCC26207]